MTRPVTLLAIPVAVTLLTGLAVPLLIAAVVVSFGVTVGAASVGVDGCSPAGTSGSSPRPLTGCTPPTATESPGPATDRAPLPGRDVWVKAVLTFAVAQTGRPYRMGAVGPGAYDCSSLVQAAWARAGIRLPRLAADQRNWAAAAGHATRINPGQEQPGDVLFWDSYLGPNTIGHVALVWDPARHLTIDARNPTRGIGHFPYTPQHHRYEIWRIHP